MAVSRWLTHAADRDRAPMEVRVLAAMAAVGGVCALLEAIFPANPDAPVALLVGSAAFMLPAAALILLAGHRVSHRLLPWLTAIGTLGISLAIARTATPVGMVVTASAYLWIAVYAGFFFSTRATRLQLALIAAGFGAALLASDQTVPVQGWVFITASAVIAGVTVGSLSDRLLREAQTDPLTGLLNRKGLEPAAGRAFSLADRTGLPLTIAMVDLDHFKQINDRLGHAAGDRVLVDLSRAWESEIEATDIFARLGGDEFLLILAGSSDQESARLFERLRFVSPAAWTVGVAKRDRGEDLSSCLAKTDAALYEAKRAREPNDRMPVSLHAAGATANLLVP